MAKDSYLPAKAKNFVFLSSFSLKNIKISRNYFRKLVVLLAKDSYLPAKAKNFVFLSSFSLKNIKISLNFFRKVVVLLLKVFHALEKTMIIHLTVSHPL